MAPLTMAAKLRTARSTGRSWPVEMNIVAASASTEISEATLATTAPSAALVRNDVNRVRSSASIATHETTSTAAPVSAR